MPMKKEQTVEILEVASENVIVQEMGLGHFTPEE